MEKNVYAGARSGFPKAVGSGCLLHHQMQGTLDSREMTPIRDWDGLGPISQASYLRFPHLSLPETQGLQAHSAPPGSETQEA